MTRHASVVGTLAGLALAASGVRAPAQQHPEVRVEAPPPGLDLHFTVDDSDPIEDADDESVPSGETRALPPITTAGDAVVGASRLTDEHSAFTVRAVPDFARASDASARAALGAELTSLSVGADHLRASGPFRTAISASLVRASNGAPGGLGTEAKTRRLRRIGRAFLEERGARALGTSADVEYRALDALTAPSGGVVTYRRAVRGVLCPDSRVMVAIDNDGLVRSFGGPLLDLDAILPALDQARVDEPMAQQSVRAFLTAEELAQLALPSPDAPVGAATLTCWNSPPHVLWAIDTYLGTFLVDAVTGEVRGRRP